MSGQNAPLIVCRILREEKGRLQSEMEKVTKVATLVGSRLARLVMDARRSTSGNGQLVEELKRYNRRLEVCVLACFSQRLCTLHGELVIFASCTAAPMQAGFPLSRR